MNEFSSPLGDIYYLLVINDLMELIKSFRPLSGISIIYVWIGYHALTRQASFRPLSGISIIYQIDTFKAMALDSFRPLSGISIIYRH